MASTQNLIVSTKRLRILYEDNHLIAVNKPSGVLVQGDVSGALSLLDMTREYIRNKYRKPGKVFLGLVHRLDRPVEGVVLFAKTSKAASRISEQLRSRTVEKIYWALVHGTPTPDSGRSVSFLKEGKKKVMLKGEGEKTGKEAVLSYRTIRSVKGKTLVEIRLHTGRKHQIRAQFSELGHPIEGDVKYGAPRGLKDGSIRLMAKSLSFKHPTREERITLEAPPPEWAKPEISVQGSGAGQATVPASWCRGYGRGKGGSKE
jgi:23S rRNA pseudouridine1911/1915/1917 synthase